MTFSFKKCRKISILGYNFIVMFGRIMVVILYGFSGALYLWATILALRKRPRWEPTAVLLLVYAALSLIWQITWTVAYVGGLKSLDNDIVKNLPLYGVFTLSLVFWYLSASFLRRKQLGRWWWVWGGIWFLVALVVDVNWLALPDVVWETGGRAFRRTDLTLPQLVLGWGICVGSITLLTGKIYRRTRQIMLRNRIIYWASGLVLTLGGDILIFFRNVEVGSLLRLSGTLVIVYIVLAKRLLDLRVLMRRVMSVMIVVILELALFTLFSLGHKILTPASDNIGSLLFGMGLTLVLLLLFNPLHNWVTSWVSNVIMRAGTDPTLILREYSQSISNILEMDLLSRTVIDLIADALDVRTGALLSVESDKDDDGKPCYHLKGVDGISGQILMPVVLSGDSPIATALGVNRQHFIHSDVDLVPWFRELTGKEQRWLSEMNLDLYVPIHAKDEWIGVLALGPKASGASFFADDIELLCTLGDQTAVALQNARLVDSLKRINSEFRRAYSAMQEAHAELELIDKTKSDFISIASHELRSPLTVLSGYSQMLLDDPDLNENPDYVKVLSGIKEGTQRLQEIVESMLDIAKLDARKYDLRTKPLNIQGIISTISQDLSESLRERDLQLALIDLDDLPPIQGDLEALKKVFFHLIVNAIKFTPDGGKINVVARAIPKGEAVYPLGGLEIVVSDTGIGVDPKYQDLIFSKFYQTGELDLRSSGKTKFKASGPGLGLAIVQGIVEAHNGKVWVESQGYDEDTHPGSQFHVILPLHQEA
jgi:signal transduction histidine kinase